MAGKSNKIISKASPHTIKKFELIEEYIKSWSQKLMLNDSYNGLIFIESTSESCQSDVGEHRALPDSEHNRSGFARDTGSYSIYRQDFLRKDELQ